MSNEITLKPIGAINRSDDEVWLAVDEPYRPALPELDRFSHILVLWWASRHDDEKSRTAMQTSLPYAPGVSAGVFACRAEYRPNPITITTCPLLDVNVESGVVKVAAIDAFDDSPLLDIKPYVGVVDRVADVSVPDWYEGRLEWLPEEGIGLQDEDWVVERGAAQVRVRSGGSENGEVARRGVGDIVEAPSGAAGHSSEFVG